MNTLNILDDSQWVPLGSTKKEPSFDPNPLCSSGTSDYPPDYIPSVYEDDYESDPIEEYNSTWGYF